MNPLSGDDIFLSFSRAQNEEGVEISISAKRTPETLVSMSFDLNEAYGVRLFDTIADILNEKIGFQKCE